MRRRVIVAFAVFAAYLVVSTAPVAASHGALAVGSEHTDFGTGDESQPALLSNAGVVGSGDSASVQFPVAFEDGFEDEPADTGPPEAWQDDGANLSEVQTTIVHDGAQAAHIVSDASKSYATGVKRDLSGDTTGNASAWLQHSGGYVSTFTLWEGRRTIEIRHYGDSLETRSGTTLTTTVSGGEWTFVEIYAIDPSSDTYSVYWETESGDSGVTTGIPMANGMQDGYEELHIGNVNGELYFDTVTVELSSESGRYLSANHSASGVVEGWTNLTLSNASATVTWKGYEGGSWVTINQQTVSSSGNYTANLEQNVIDGGSEPYSGTMRVNVTFEATGANPTAELHDEGVLVETSAPTIDDSSLSPNTTSASQALPITLSADVSDPDFTLPSGDSGTVYWYVDGQQRGTTTVSANGTTTLELSNVGAGEHSWHIEVEDEYGHRTTSATASFAMPAELRIYNESAPSELVDNATVELRMLTNETGAVEVYERSTSDGTINMSGLPADKPFIVVADADGYYGRRIFVKSLFDTQSIYLLPESEQVSDTIFSIDDYTGQYPSEDTVLLVQRPLNGSYRTVLGDYFGGTGEFPAELAFNTRHRLVIYNVETGSERVVGTYTPLTASTQTVVVTPKGVTTVGGEPPSIVLQPQVRRLPALDAADLSVTVREGELDVANWNVTASLQNESATTTVWTASDSSPGTLSKSINLDGRHESMLVVNVTWTTSEGLSATETYRIAITEAIGNDQSLLDGLSALAQLSPAGNARAAFTGFLAMLITVFVVAGVGSIQPSGEIAGLAGILTLTGFAVIGFGVTYDVVFTASVGWVAFAALRRGV